MVHLVKDKKDFDEQLCAAGSKLVVVGFFATWCGPCKAIAPKLEEISNTYTGKAVGLKVDVDECVDIALEYFITSMPTFIFIKNGDDIKRFSGANVDDLKKYFATYV